ncbi:MAG: hypothetical protein K1X57_10520 [Gemmataceae bacterium]|nr:hypothetical protein [Gemmataceae bacterium]
MMPAAELYAAWALGLAILSVAVVFGYRQIRTGLKSAATDEAVMLRTSAHRRIVVSILLATCGLLVIVPYATNVAGDIARIAPDHKPTDAEMAATRAYAWCWIAIATLLFVALVVIAWDMLIVRRYWARSLSRLHDDRRAMIARQLSRHRAEKNGYHSDE